VVTPLAVLAWNRETKRLELESAHPGISREQLQQATGFPLVAQREGAVTPPPTDADLATLRGPVRDAVAKVYPVFCRTAFLAA
jgi:hypothetical protein